MKALSWRTGAISGEMINTHPKQPHGIRQAQTALVDSGAAAATAASQSRCLTHLCKNIEYAIPNMSMLDSCRTTCRHALKMTCIWRETIHAKRRLLLRIVLSELQLFSQQPSHQLNPPAILPASRRKFFHRSFHRLLYQISKMITPAQTNREDTYREP
jgi:hypothetical protein